MRILTKTLIIGAGSALFAMPALAQGRPLPPQAPPARAQQAEAGHATPPAPSQAPVVTPRAGYGRSIYDGPVVYTNVPVTVASDGRVYANFGSGYQWVPQQCSAQQSSRTRSTTPGQVQIPVQVGQQDVTPQVVGPAPINGAGACWTRTRNGSVVVHR
jgi:hypothetical protein